MMKGEAEVQRLSFFRQPFDEKMMNVYHTAIQCVMPCIHRIIVFTGHHRFHGNTAHPHSEKTGSRSLPARKARTATTDAAQDNIGLPADSRMSVSDIGEDIEAWRKLQELRSMPNGGKRELLKTHPVWIGREQVYVSGRPKPLAPLQTSQGKHIPLVYLMYNYYNQ